MDSQTIAQKIKNIRKELGYTQAEFGKALGNVSYSTVSDWENAKNVPSDANICKIAEISQGNLLDLFEDEPADETTQPSVDSQLVKELEEKNEELTMKNEELRNQLEEEEKERKKLQKKKKKLKKKIKKLK
ncbi:MAG: helix-turn-helix transcriptional regulator [Atopococcus tabaci]|uniref:Helix-turn-helix transcriptional regulator n=1 Tax=Atopococcus tabaci TaxID=269774 RepID=A0AA43UCS4_9LACT|nr:helix-turn-helix transcriptional regulator [Atopococcus tabaci]